MKLTGDFLPDIIEIKESEVFSLVIEHRETFLQIIQDLYSQISTGAEGDLILSEMAR